MRFVIVGLHEWIRGAAALVWRSVSATNFPDAAFYAHVLFVSLLFQIPVFLVPTLVEVGGERLSKLFVALAKVLNWLNFKQCYES